jgi:biotin operon repressor
VGYQASGLIRLKEGCRRLKTLRPKGRKLRSARVAEEIRQRLFRGIYSPHTYLPSERDLADEFDVSRSTIVTALRTLAEDGLVVQTQGRGTRVLPSLDRLSKSIVGVLHAHPMLGLAMEPILILEGIKTALTRLKYRFDVLPMIYREDERVHLNSPVILAGDIPTLGERYGAFLFVEANQEEIWNPIFSFQEQGIPVVVANLETELEVSATWVDHRKMTFEATKMLLALGHRRIGYLGRDPAKYFYKKAEEGYRAAMQSAGVAGDQALVANTADVQEASLESFLITGEMLRTPSPPTAIVAARDYLAHGACEAIQKAGLIVGRDVSVIGFDDVSWRQDAPYLTTFREPCFELGATAAEMLAERIINGHRTVEKREIEAPLIIRRSVGPCFGDGQLQPSSAESVMVSFLAPGAPPASTVNRNAER